MYDEERRRGNREKENISRKNLPRNLWGRIGFKAKGEDSAWKKGKYSFQNLSSIGGFSDCKESKTREKKKKRGRVDLKNPAYKKRG